MLLYPNADYLFISRTAIPHPISMKRNNILADVVWRVNSSSSCVNSAVVGGLTSGTEHSQGQKDKKTQLEGPPNPSLVSSPDSYTETLNVRA